MRKQINDIIKQKKPDLDTITLNYYLNYFSVVLEEDLIPESVTLEELIENALTYASKIEFYDENHRVAKEYGLDVKGYRDPATKTIYIRNNLEEPLREIVVYHELHHAVQTNPLTGEVGINQNNNVGRLIMEAQTQYFAEKIYSKIHNITFPEREIPSEDLRMLDGGTVTSSLHNYEMYDCELSKIALLLDVPKDYFVKINYMYQNSEGLKDLEAKYNATKDKYNIQFNFYTFLCHLDYIYCVDLQTYVDNPDKQIILSGKETEHIYEIYPTVNLKLSLANQRAFINKIDILCFLSLHQQTDRCNKLMKYVIDNKTKEEFLRIMNMSTPETSSPKM